MSQIINSSSEGMQFILNDPNFILEQVLDTSEQMDDIIYTDNLQGQYCLVDGQLFSSDADTVVLQEGDDLSRYYINADEFEIKSEPQFEEPTSSQPEIVHFVDEDGNIAEEPHIIYVNKDVDLSQYQFVDPLNEADDQQALESQIVNMDEFLEESSENNSVLENLTNSHGFQYAVIKDGKLHLQSYNDELISITGIEQMQEMPDIDNSIMMHPPMLDTSEITGRDLITGETVTLDSYMNKLQKRLKFPLDMNSNQSVGKKISKRNDRVKTGLHGLLNKKLDLGKTADGKRLVGKIVKIQKKDDRPSSSEPTKNHPPPSFVSKPNTTTSDEVEQQNIVTDNKKYVIQRKIVSKECFQHISGTLGGLMNMETIKKKILNKNILVKVIEKKFVPTKKTFDKSVSYCSGYMEEKNIETDELKSTWCFVPDSNTKEALFGKLRSPNTKKFSDIINITLLITYQKNSERIQVILDSETENKCFKCPRTFRTKSLLRVHLNTEHQIEVGSKFCENCGFSYTTKQEYEEHKKMFCDSNKPKMQTVKVSKQNLIECFICLQRFANLSALNAHFNTHADEEKLEHVIAEKPNIPKKNTVYTCQICKKTFSRHSNLQRHVDIHKGQGDLYQCTVCGCSYHYISSLTRHVVQNHLRRNDEDITTAENES